MGSELKELKQYPTIACCGLDCGLCPTFYIKGPSKCPGCYGPNFIKKHPSCSIITCCVKKKHFETCAECKDFPCEKLKDWDKYDSFICHRKSISNLIFIQENSLKEYLDQQEERIELLKIMLNEYNEGRSKSFYCISTALMDILDLKKALKESEQQIEKDNVESTDIKTKSKILKYILNRKAKQKGILLKLKKK